MNKSDLIAYMAGELHTSRAHAGRLLDTVLTGIQRGLNDDKHVTITGFGTFELKPRKARIGHNPLTGEPIQIAPGRRVGFRVGKSLRSSF